MRLSDFDMTLSRRQVTSGRVSFRLENRGPTVHELVVARSDRSADDLPIGPDGLSVDEDHPAVHAMGEQEAVKLGDDQRLTLDLAPGHYVLFCNLGGHYMGGMHADLEVVA